MPKRRRARRSTQPLGGIVKVFKLVDTTFAVLVVSLGSYGILDAFFPRLHNVRKCDNDEPVNAIQSAALRDARSRASAHCSTPKARCLFWIDEGSYSDRALRVWAVAVESDLFEGCIHKDYASVIYVYSNDGRFVGTEGVPYG
jgi:hypothetical protein